MQRHRRSARRLLVVLAACVAMLVLGLASGCQHDQPAAPKAASGFTPPPPPKYTPTAEPARLRTVAVAGHRKILTEDHKRTLYTRNTPVDSQRAWCVSVCSDVWRPVVLSRSFTEKQPPGLAVRIGTFPRKGGLHQLEVNGHRVYTFMGDHRPGDMKGAGLVTGTPDRRIHEWRPIIVPSGTSSVLTLTGSGASTQPSCR